MIFDRGRSPQERVGNEPTTARSALNLRLLLATFGLLLCGGLALWFFLTDLTALGVILAVLAVLALLDIVVVLRRRRRRGGGRRGVLWGTPR
jgi:hypothetical protein